MSPDDVEVPGDDELLLAEDGGKVPEDGLVEHPVQAEHEALAQINPNSSAKSSFSRGVLKKRRLAHI